MSDSLTTLKERLARLQVPLPGWSPPDDGCASGAGRCGDALVFLSATAKVTALRIEATLFSTTGDDTEVMAKAGEELLQLSVSDGCMRLSTRWRRLWSAACAGNSYVFAPAWMLSLQRTLDVSTPPIMRTLRQLQEQAPAVPRIGRRDAVTVRRLGFTAVRADYDPVLRLPGLWSTCAGQLSPGTIPLCSDRTRVVYHQGLLHQHGTYQRRRCFPFAGHACFPRQHMPGSRLLQRSPGWLAGIHAACRMQSGGHVGVATA